MHDYSFCVNQCQSPEERRVKYAIAKQFGCTKKGADSARDYNWSKLNGHLCRLFPEAKIEIEDLVKASYDVFKRHRNAVEAEIRYIVNAPNGNPQYLRKIVPPEEVNI